jgi:hypothetical protein
MTPSEFEGWRHFYSLHPFDDRSRYHRPALMLGVQMGGDMKTLGDWIDRVPDPFEGYSEAEVATFKAFGVTPPKKG